MNRSARIVFILFLLTVIIGTDHITKWIAIRTLKETGASYSFWDDVFRLQYAENKGAFLSLGASLPAGMRTFIMTGVNTIVLGALLLYLLTARTIASVTVCAFGLVVAGGIGNLIDRIFRDGRVVDFMNMGIRIGPLSLRTGIFNIADVAIMAGLFLLLLHEALTIYYAKKTAKTTDTPEGSTKKGRKTKPST